MIRARALFGTALAAAVAALPAVAQEQPAAVPGPAMTAPVDEPLVRPADHVLVWSDEFDRPGLPDRAKWRYDTHANKTGWYNQELQYYSGPRRENARVEDGKLVIEARRERLARAPDFGGQDYSSSRMITRGLADWTYGFFEIRAKLPCGRGVWPAIWMLGSGGGGWPLQGEIDIMEHVGWDPGRVHGNVHTKAHNHVAGTQKGAWTMVPTACQAFHDYQLLWTPERIVVGVDGRGYMAFANEGKGKDHWPFDRAQHLLLNVAVGGWGGTQGIDPTAFPAKLEVDYVRVWQKKR